jgi:hypothetical protein
VWICDDLGYFVLRLLALCCAGQVFLVIMCCSNFAVFCSLVQIYICMFRILYTHIYMYVCIYIHVRVTGTVFSLALMMRIPSMCWMKNCHFYFRGSSWACRARNFGGMCLSGLYEPLK